MSVPEGRMRICVCSVNYFPEHTGIAPYTTALAEGLVANGHEVTVLTAPPHYPHRHVAEEHRHLVGTTRSENGVTVRRLPSYVPSNPSLKHRLAFESAFGGKAVAARWGRPDVVLTMSPSLIASGMVVARARASGTPVGVIVQDLYGRGVVETGAMSGGMADAATKFEASILRAATGVSVIHDRFAAATTDMGVPRDRVRVIRNWTHVEARDPSTDVAALRSRLGWSPDDCIVLHSGNMGVKQGLENVVDAAKVADTRELRVRFIMLGDGNQRPALVERATEVARIEFMESVDEDVYRDVLAAADVLLLNERPGVGEMAVPSKLTSYFAAGRPVLASTDPGGVTAQEVDRAGAGVVVPAGDPAALIDALLRLVDDPPACRAMGSAGQDYAHRVLGADHAIAQYDQWCRDLVRGAGRRRPPDGSA
ncbi:glycosyltransferase WbuB [Mycolicibacterium sediminis]|uniref:Glycosyltransferase WbuB n=1 Tax=Mycolicibacterium sediminis TaxID=1286180 RepID=A0A7I7QRF4_9MYCO|nr:glycosyltransferase WbuB [Mycolicibacterium sediminis]